MSARDVYDARGFGGRQGAGERPAVVVVDFIEGFTNPESALACDADAAVGAARRLLDAARAAGLPVIFTTVCYDDDDLERAAMFVAKAPALATLRPGSPWVEVDARLAPRPGRDGARQALRVGVLRHTARRDAPRGRVRHRRRHRRVHLGLRPRDGGRRAPVRLPRARAARGRRRPRGRRAQRLAARHRREVRRRRLDRRGDRGRRGGIRRGPSGRERRAPRSSASTPRASSSARAPRPRRASTSGSSASRARSSSATAS